MRYVVAPRVVFRRDAMEHEKATYFFRHYRTVTALGLSFLQTMTSIGKIVLTSHTLHANLLLSEKRNGKQKLNLFLQ